jgi:hypothetical protein
MPFYYTTNAQGLSTNASAATETDNLSMQTGASGRTGMVVQVLATGRNAAVGGASMRLRRFTTASTSGSTNNPVAKDPTAPAATLTGVTGPTAGATVKNVMSIGWSQTGAQGFWGASEPNDAVVLIPGSSAGPANGNLDFFSIANGTSVPFDLTVESIE